MDLSIVVPAYNEESRIQSFAKDLLRFSEKNLKNYEIIFVNDGSTDKTEKILKNIEKKCSRKNVRIISYNKNKGKGYAVKKGVLSSKGENILFIDADGSINPSEIPKMVEKLKEYNIVIGDRSSKYSEIKQSPLRYITGNTYSILANSLFPIRIKDTLCGFKGFNKETAKDLFEKLVSTGWIFDLELLYMAKKKKYKIYRLPFKWEHKEGTRMKLYTPLIMIWETIKLRARMVL